jgi:hypothetical protein
MAARTTAIVSFAIFFIFGVGCSWRGAVAGCGSWRGCVDNGSSCGVVLKLSNRFFGALAGARAGCLAGDPKIPERLCSAPTGADFLGLLIATRPAIDPMRSTN